MRFASQAPDSTVGILLFYSTVFMSLSWDWFPPTLPSGFSGVVGEPVRTWRRELPPLSTHGHASLLPISLRGISSFLLSPFLRSVHVIPSCCLHVHTLVGYPLR